MKIEDKEKKYGSRKRKILQILKLFYTDCIEFYTLYPSKVCKTRISFQVLVNTKQSRKYLRDKLRICILT